MIRRLRVGFRVRVRGRVQGVFFRASMKRVAAENGVTGWVRNNPDGSVEALLLGEEGRVNAVVEWARRGPPGARVDEMSLEEVKDEEGGSADFRIVR